MADLRATRSGRHAALPRGTVLHRGDFRGITASTGLDIAHADMVIFSPVGPPIGIDRGVLQSNGSRMRVRHRAMDRDVCADIVILWHPSVSHRHFHRRSSPLFASVVRARRSGVRLHRTPFKGRSQGVCHRTRVGCRAGVSIERTGQAVQQDRRSGCSRRAAGWWGVAPPAALEQVQYSFDEMCHGKGPAGGMAVGRRDPLMAGG